MKKRLKRSFEAIKGVWACYSRANCGMHAAGLTYFSMLALMPLLCVLLLCARSCGAGDYVMAQVNEQVEELISSVEKGQDDDLASLTPIDEKTREERRVEAKAFGEQARAMSAKLSKQIEQFDAHTLGWVGCLMLVWTVISSISMIEVTFNQIWGVKKVRPIWHRVWLYLLIAALLPPLMALSAAAPLAKIVKDIMILFEGPEHLTSLSTGFVALVDSRLVRFVMATFFTATAFAALYKIIPNCAVRTSNAWRGGLFAALVFGVWVKLCAVLQIGIAKSSALYGSFALLPIILAWLYMSWQIVLLGAVVVRSLEARQKPISIA